ncbi:MAG TPA: hypothetical protein VIL88_15870 [Devosia sp.]|uniref:hypothetical protein n=1 Tax=Devosia sp. TaxID=1871048 RepID=UPI002F9382BB
MNEVKSPRLINTQASRAIELPSSFELPREFDQPEVELSVVKGGNQLIIRADAKLEGRGRMTFAEMLDQMETIDIEWPNVDEGLLPPDDIKL